MMHIIDRVKNVKADFTAQTGREPTELYLGSDEIVEINKLPLPFVAEKIQTQIHGLSIHFINTRSHFSIGISADKI